MRKVVLTNNNSTISNDFDDPFDCVSYKTKEIDSILSSNNSFIVYNSYSNGYIGVQYFYTLQNKTIHVNSVKVFSNKTNNTITIASKIVKIHKLGICSFIQKIPNKSLVLYNKKNIQNASDNTKKNSALIENKELQVYICNRIPFELLNKNKSIEAIFFEMHGFILKINF